MAYAAANDGQYPWRPGGSGQVQNPWDHNVYILQQANLYGAPYGMWMCADYMPPLEERNKIIKANVDANIANNVWKYFNGTTLTYWVEQGGNSAGLVYNARPTDSVWSRYVRKQKPSNVIIADYMLCTNPGVPRNPNHTRKGKSLHSFVACADGHVEKRDVSEVRRRYLSNSSATWQFAY